MAAPETLRLPRALVAELRQLAQRSPTEEICGLITVDARGGTHHYPIANVAHGRDRFFALDPKGQIDAMREMRRRGETLYAVYHSHPHGAATPSVRDIERHEYAEAACVVLALDPPALKAFRIAGGEAQEIPVEVM